MSRRYYRTLSACACAFILASSVFAAEVIHDIEYESPGGWRNQLDLYTPDGGARDGFPTLIYIHGGGWRTGDKSTNSDLSIMLTNAGYSVVSCNYTLSRDISPSFPQAVHDVKAVVRWIRTVGVNQYNLSPEVVPYGTSAGGHLSLMLGTTAGMNFFEPLSPPPGGYRVDAFISFFGPSDLVTLGEDGFGDDPRLVAFLGEPFNEQTRDLWALASPITHVDIGDPALSIYHGTNDDIVPFSQASLMQDAATQAEMLSWFFPFDGGHGFRGLGGRPGGALRMRQIIPPMIARDATGNTPLTGLTLQTGILLEGDLPALFESDNAALGIRSGFGETLIDLHNMTIDVAAEEGIVNPKFADLTIETRIDAPAGTARVFLRNWTEDAFESVGSFAIGTTETTTTIESIPLVNRVNELGDIDMRLRHIVFVPFLAFTFESFIDQVEIVVK